MTKSQIKMINAAEVEAIQLRNQADGVMQEALGILAEENKIEVTKDTIVEFERGDRNQIINVKFGKRPPAKPTLVEKTDGRSDA